MIKALICGINGKMGKNVAELVAVDGEIETVCGVDVAACDGLPPVYSSFNDVKEEIDVIIDFSSPAALKGELEFAVKNKKPVVLAATGYGEEHLKMIKDAS